MCRFISTYCFIISLVQYLYVASLVVTDLAQLVMLGNVIILITASLSCISALVIHLRSTQEIIIGEDATIQSMISGINQKDFTFRWYLNERRGLESDITVKLTSLEIRNATIDDSGIYKCVATSKLAKIAYNTIANLSVTTVRTGQSETLLGQDPQHCPSKTGGARCLECQYGYYTEDLLALPSKGCKMCADTCGNNSLNCAYISGQVTCYCKPGYGSSRCETCVAGYVRDGDDCNLIAVS